MRGWPSRSPGPQCPAPSRGVPERRSDQLLDQLDLTYTASDLVGFWSV